MQSSSTFIRRSRPIPEKKFVLINNRENIAYWEEIKQSEMLPKKFSLFQMQWKGLGKSKPQENFPIFTRI